MFTNNSLTMFLLNPEKQIEELLESKFIFGDSHYVDLIGKVCFKSKYSPKIRNCFLNCLEQLHH